ncbi:unnamed protein product [Didymodactylos carnosus]|uniref:Thyroglobulin type-1 domain-containing protein n=1 Tax=Didymodactylos carnosus TaxID=1234261 RepID=A0A813T1T5_9BILA|nr:unnamed protein product [Didymodactylos carnosus]CAF3588230.1 unnamed protein product [Didymodactylos carnosus]
MDVLNRMDHIVVVVHRVLNFLVHENDHCFDFHSGTQPIKECRPGLVCNKKTNKCELLKCFDQLKKLNKNDTNSILIPNCKPDGTFAPRQCNKTSCYCVSFHGQLLTQFKSSSIDSKRYCHCAQLFNGNISWKTRCDKYGDYLLVQCKGKICYCVNLDGKILKNMEFFSRTKSVENEQYCLNLQKKKGIKTI